MRYAAATVNSEIPEIQAMVFGAGIPERAAMSFYLMWGFWWR